MKPRPSEVFGRNVRTVREQQGLSQKQLEDSTGIPRTTISQIEHGRANATLDTMARLANALSTDLGSLLTGI